MRSGPEPFDSEDVTALAEAQQAEMRGRYEGVADIGPSRVADMFVPPDGVFLVVRDDGGRPLGCGGICRFDEARAELKRMYVTPEARGTGPRGPLLTEAQGDASPAGSSRALP